MNKPLVIYHDHCTDGFGAAYCAWLSFKGRADYLPMSYGQPIPDIQDRPVYILDFSFSPGDMKDIIQQSEYTVWLDHHKSAFENWAGDERELYVDETEYTYIVLDNNKSGTMLAWEYFNPERLCPEWVQWIDDRDRWQFKLEDSKAFHAGMATRKPWTFEQWDEVIACGEVLKDWPVVSEGHVLLTSQEGQVNSVAKHARQCMIHTLLNPETGKPNSNTLVTWSCPGLAVNTNVHMSEVGHELANQSGSYGLVWYLGSDNMAKVSLRSNGNYDVSSIARQFGGGGHKNAAGFQVSITTLLEWLK